MLEGILIEGLVYGIMALGVFITFRVLNFADLSVDGSFPLGSAIMVVTRFTDLPHRFPFYWPLPGAVLRDW